MQLEVDDGECSWRLMTKVDVEENYSLYLAVVLDVRCILCWETVSDVSYSL